MLRRRKALTGVMATLACMALPAVAAAHGPPKITAGPEGTVTATDARFEFSYDEPAPSQTFECSLDGADFTECEDGTFSLDDPTGFQTYKDLAEGPHVFKVRRVSSFPMDPLADPTPAERKWTIDLPDPEPTPTPSPDPSATPTPPPGPPPPTLDADKPGPCDGVFQVTDGEGDYHHAATDILGAFFRYAGGTLTANIVLKDLQPVVQHEENRTVFWRMQWVDSAGKGRYVGAKVDKTAGNATTFEYGAVTGATFTREGDTTGKLFMGAKGLVQIAVPGVAAGSTLARPVAVTGEEKLAGGEPDWGDRAPGANAPGDPKATSAGADYVVAGCSSPPPPGQGAPASGVTGVVLDVTALSVRYGRRVEIAGRIVPGNSDVPVELLDASGKVLAKTITKAGGAFSFRLRPRDTLELRARSAGVSSASLLVKVKPLVRLRKVAVKAGLRLKGWVRPARVKTVDVQQRSGGQWISVGRPRLRNGRFTLTVRGVRRGRFRVKEITS